MKEIDKCPTCKGFKCEKCNFTGLRNSSKHGAPSNEELIEELKARRVALWKFAHSLPEGDEKRIEAETAAKKIYDGLRSLKQI